MSDKFPQTYRNEAGMELIAKDDVQAHVFKREGFELVEDKKKPAVPEK